MSSCNLILTGAAMADCALTGDIMIEILSRLPVKSLMRFRCVCKPWCSLTTNPSFITKHLTHNTNESLIIHSGGHKKSRYLISMLRHGKKKLDPPVNLKLPFAEVSSDVQIMGSCNGLLCIYDVSGIFLWNPATREYRRLPEPGIWILKLSLDSICLEFGFDANANDYKLVRVLRCSSRGFDVPNLVYKAEVYSKKTNSWKEINAALQCRLIELSPAADFGGRVHWRAYRFDDHWTADGSNNSELIAYFDLGREVFGEIQLLDCFVSGFQRGRALAVVKDLLAFVVYPYEEDLNRVIEVWVMKEYGVKESWTKQLSIGPFSIIGRPLAYFRNGKFLLQNKRGKLFWYDSNSQKFDMLGVFIARYIYVVHTCVETLVSVKGGE